MKLFKFLAFTLLSVIMMSFLLSNAMTYRTNQMCLAATSEKSNELLLKVANAKDKDALKQMVQNGEVVLLKEGTRVIKLSGLITYRVRVLTGDYKNEEVYIAVEFLTRE